MIENTVCNVCVTHGRLDDALEVNQICSNVRKFKDNTFTVWRCESCHSLHSKEGVDLPYYYRHYPVTQQKLDFWTKSAYRNYLKRLKKSGMKKEHEILDFGCSQGLFVSYLRKKGYSHVQGYDPYVAQFSNKELLDRTYDVIIAQDVIEHTDEPRKLMNKLLRCLSPEGILCIGTPNAEYIDISHPMKCADSLHQPYHRHILSEKALITLGKTIGLSAKNIYYRCYYDTLYPSVNFRFLQTYLRYAGNMFDSAFEPPRVWMVLSSPLLLFYALFGYFFPPRSEIMIFFHRRHDNLQEEYTNEETL